eukprot:gene11689-biopygen9436
MASLSAKIAGNSGSALAGGGPALDVVRPRCPSKRSVKKMWSPHKRLLPEHVCASIPSSSTPDGVGYGRRSHQSRPGGIPTFAFVDFLRVLVLLAFVPSQPPASV